MDTEQSLIKLAMNQGLYAVLFVVLLFYLLKESAKREASYQEVIKQMTDSISAKIDQLIKK